MFPIDLSCFVCLLVYFGLVGPHLEVLEGLNLGLQHAKHAFCPLRNFSSPRFCCCFLLLISWLCKHRKSFSGYCRDPNERTLGTKVAIGNLPAVTHISGSGLKRGWLESGGHGKLNKALNKAFGRGRFLPQVAL